MENCSLSLALRVVFRKYYNGERINDTDPFEGAAPTPEAHCARGLMLPQWRVEGELRRLLASHGVEVERGSELVGFSAGLPLEHPTDSPPLSGVRAA